MSKQTIGIIGLGNMAGAIIKGLREGRGFQDADLIAFDRHPEKQQDYALRYAVRQAKDACEVVRESEAFILAIKPQGMEELLEKIKPCLKDGQLVISLAAGKSLQFFSDRLSPGQPLVRALPNINAKAGASMTALCQNEFVSASQAELAISIFDAVGSVTLLPESKLAAFASITGCGPAFAYLFIDALATAGVRAGLPRPLAQQAACGMLLGSAKLAAEAGEHPRALIDQVTSPGGTTIEGMHKLAELGFEHAVHEAIAAVIAKEKNL